MKHLKLNAMVLAISSGVMQLASAAPFVSDQADAQGFVQGSQFDLLLRNYYFNRDGKNGAGDQRDWTQGFFADYRSGFTEGTVGFAVEAFGYLGVKLDGGDGTSGTGNLPVDNAGKLKDDYSNTGGVLKMRVSKTQLKWGEMQPVAPVFAVGGSRLLPQTATGFNLMSSEISGLDLEAGHFTGGTGPTTSHSRGELFATYADVATDSVDYVGGKYAISDDLSVTLYGSEFEDIWRQYYANVNYNLELAAGQSLNFDANLYRTNDYGRAEAGKIDNTAWSLATAYSFLDAHTLTLAFQQVDSDTPLDYIGLGTNGAGDGGDSIFLANAVQFSDFNGPGEKSWQVRYDLAMDRYGVPGLSFMARYVNGSGIDGTRVDADSAYANLYGDGGKHHETNFEARYVVQSGAAKDLSFRIRQAWHSANAEQGEADASEFRLIVDYPLSIL